MDLFGVFGDFSSNELFLKRIVFELSVTIRAASELSSAIVGLILPLELYSVWLCCHQRLLSGIALCPAGGLSHNCSVGQLMELLEQIVSVLT